MDNSFKNILVFGIGGVGGYFGGKLAYHATQKQTGQNVYFVARGNHLSEIQKNGLVLNTHEGQLICKPTGISSNVTDFPSPDLCLVCTKSYALEDAIKQLEPLIKENTVVLPLLNGVDIYERIRKITKKGIVLPSCVYVASHIEKPGVVSQKGPFGSIVSGSDGSNSLFNPDALIELFQKSDIKFKWVDDPFFAIWEKYIFVASFALVTAYTGKTFVEVATNEETSAMVREIISEIKEVAKAENIVLPDNTFDLSIAKAVKLPADAKTSFQRDVEKGKDNEGDIFGKTILVKAQKYGIKTPVISRLYNEIQNM
jgi:2-dehydropantoate 2-reductase